MIGKSLEILLEIWKRLQFIPITTEPHRPLPKASYVTLTLPRLIIGSLLGLDSLQFKGDWLS